MPTKRTRRTRNIRHADISELAWRFLNDGSIPEDYNTWEFFMLQYNHFDHATGYTSESIWELYADEITATWIKEKPGTRPKCWWRYSAPRKAEQGHRKHMFPLIETRRVLLGPATTEDRVPAGDFGIPRIHCESNRTAGQIESQAAYLKRHGLLTPDETRRLKSYD
jgi:hypothetical protein